MSNNNVKEWIEFQKLAELSNLEELVFVGKSLWQKLLITRHMMTCSFILMHYEIKYLGMRYLLLSV